MFNRGRFFESHETLEQFYLESDNEHKPFVEGLVQLATAFRILRDFGEVKGPVRMIYQALIRFENYQPIYLEIRVKELIESMEAWAKSAETGGSKIRTAIPKITPAASAFSFDD